MANQRSKNQTLVAFPLDVGLLGAVDQARGRGSRSQFIREALASYLRSMGHPIPESVVVAPDRVKSAVADNMPEPGYGSRAAKLENQAAVNARRVDR